MIKGLRMMRIGVAVMPLLFAASSASAMTVADFLTRADALKAMGLGAMFHRDEIALLTAEVREAVKAYREEAGKAQAEGDKSLGCPPPANEVHLSTDDFLKGFQAIPAERRKVISVRAGFYEMMKTRYPC